MAAVAESLSRTPMDVAAKPIDTTALEIKILQQSLGLLLPALLRSLGVSRLKTRRDIDNIARTLIGMGL